MGQGMVVNDTPVSLPEIITTLAEGKCTITSAQRLISS